MCGLGRLYSKQNVIEQLLDREKEMPDSCKHIKSLKDVKNLVLTPNPAYKDCDKTEGLLDVRSAPYICKLIGIEMTGKFRFIALWTCGCVYSERALKEIGSKVCSLCQTPFDECDVVILNGNEEEAAAMAVKMEARNARRKAAKKDKSAKKAAVATATITSDEVVIKQEFQVQVKQEFGESSKKKDRTTMKPGTSTIARDAANKLKRTAATDALLDPELKKLKDDSASLATDPQKSDVYKSLFTTHHTSQTQERAHWVTYNPFYN